jgi:Reverse transcriptase (RNA-dependent DNA polymerase)
MDNEMHAIMKNNTWELTSLPKGYKAIGVKWVYKKKVNSQGEIVKHKARLVAKDNKLVSIMRRYLHRWQEWRLFDF